MITKIKSDVWQFSFKNFGSHIYLIKLKDKNILIDTSSPENQRGLIEDLNKLGLKPKDIKTIIFTHNHPDHIGRILPFLQTTNFYGSKKDFGENMNDIKKLKIPELKIIETPGHSKGGICILYENILFSGDTLFHRGTTGRTDLPGSSEKEMKNSINKLKEIKYKILAPGHGRE